MDNNNNKDMFSDINLDDLFSDFSPSSKKPKEEHGDFGFDAENFSMSSAADEDTSDYDDMDFGDFDLFGGAEEESPEEKKEKHRRKLMETRISLLSMAILIPVFCFFVIYMLFFPKSHVSQIEKRTLAKFPSFSFGSYFKAEFTTRITEWFTDTIPNRDKLKNAGYSIKSTFGLPSSEDDIIFVNNATKKTNEPPVNNTDKEEKADAPVNVNVQEKETPVDTTGIFETATAETANTSAGGKEYSDAKLKGSAGRRSKHIKIGTIADTEAEQTDFTKQDNEFDWSDGLIIVNVDGHYRVLGLFGYGDSTDYVNGLNDLRKALDSNINIWSMPCPLASEFYTPANAMEYTYSHNDRFEEIAGELDAGITSINVCPVLAKHTEEDIYLRTDHHWSQLGAYYAARTFAEAAGVPFADIDTFEKGVNEGYIGSYYGYTEDYRILNDPEDFTYYKPKQTVDTYSYDRYFNYQYSDSLFIETDTPNSYMMFIGGDDQILKVKGTANNGRKLMVIKDSYGNAEIPWYVASFEEIWVVDLRYFELNLIDFINFTGTTDVLFSTCSYSVVGGNSENIPYLLTQAKGQTLYDEALEDENSSTSVNTDTTADTTEENTDDSTDEE
ncbi:MAG: DHHW family protein [Clostridia bacterium]|nr:DHHW family protein [Clostridia bacterium]